MNRSRDGGEIRGHMMLEAVRANKVQELLHFGDFDYPRAAESVQRIVGKLSFSHVTAHLALGIVGGETRKAHLFRLDESDARPKGVFFPYRASDDFLEVHLHGAEEGLGQVGAVKAHSLIRVRSVIIVPVEQSRGSAGSQPERMHAEHAADVDLAGARQQAIAHHAHDRARNHAQVLFDRGPTLHRADGYFSGRHPLIHDCAKLRHLQQSCFWNRAGIHVLLDGSQLGLRHVVIVLGSLDPAEHFGEIEGLDGDAVGFKNLLAVTHSIEGGRTRADRTHAKIPKAIDHATCPCKPFEVPREFRRVGALGVQGRNGVRNPVLAEIVAG